MFEILNVWICEWNEEQTCAICMYIGSPRAIYRYNNNALGGHELRIATDTTKEHLLYILRDCIPIDANFSLSRITHNSKSILHGLVPSRVRRMSTNTSKLCSSWRRQTSSGFYYSKNTTLSPFNTLVLMFTLLGILFTAQCPSKWFLLHP